MEGIPLSPKEMGLDSGQTQINPPVKDEVVSEAQFRKKAESMHYQDETEINGIRIEVRQQDGRYVIFFPQVDTSTERARDLGVWDQGIPLTDDREEATKAFKTAINAASNASDAYEAYSKAYNLVF